MDHLLSFTDGDLELEGELSVLFLSSAEAYFDKMGRSLRAGTPWTSTAHALKGASANLGARRLAALARSAEQQPPSAADLAGDSARHRRGERVLRRAPPGRQGVAPLATGPAGACGCRAAIGRAPSTITLIVALILP